jgi:hypothetical protein
VAIKVIVNVASAADWIVAEATARFRLDRDSSVAFSAPSEVTTTALVAGTDRYEVWDAGGASTSWYRFRIENDADSGISDWSTPWQVTSDQPIATLAGVKQRLGTTSSVDDDMLDRYVRDVNTDIIRRLGYFPGPSGDTERLYDGRDAVCGDTRLWVTGGFRSLSKVETATSSSGTFTEVAAADWMAGPKAWSLAPGEPYGYVELLSGTFPADVENVRLTGVFGWASPPADLVDAAEALVVVKWKRRAAGTGGLGTDEAGRTPEWIAGKDLEMVISHYRLPMVA